MSETMLERVARAIDYEALDQDSLFSNSDLKDCDDAKGWASRAQEVRRLARAAIAALRDPTPAMQRAWRGPAPWDQDALEVWQAMIDEAMK